MFIGRIAEIMLGNYSPCQTDRRMFGNKNSFSCQLNLPFCVEDEIKLNRKLTVAYHRHMEKNAK